MNTKTLIEFIIYKHQHQSFILSLPFVKVDFPRCFSLLKGESFKVQVYKPVRNIHRSASYIFFIRTINTVVHLAAACSKRRQHNQTAFSHNCFKSVYHTVIVIWCSPYNPNKRALIQSELFAFYYLKLYYSSLVLFLRTISTNSASAAAPNIAL